MSNTPELTQEENNIEAANVETTAEVNIEAASIGADTKSKSTKETNNDRVKKIFLGNLLYEESLGFIPGSLRGKQDPKYVFNKFGKQYKPFDFPNEDFLEILEADLLKYIVLLLQILKTNKTIDIRFRMEDAADFLLSKHIEIRGKPIPFLRKAKRILKITVK